MNLKRAKSGYIVVLEGHKCYYSFKNMFKILEKLLNVRKLRQFKIFPIMERKYLASLESQF